jgi:hypothetical protein
MNNLWTLNNEIRQLEIQRDNLNIDKREWYGSIALNLTGPAIVCTNMIKYRNPSLIRPCLSELCTSVASMYVDYYKINNELTNIEGKLREKQSLLNSTINSYQGWYNKLGGIKLDAECQIRGTSDGYNVGVDMSSAEIVTIELIKGLQERRKYILSKPAFEYALMCGIGDLYPGLYFTIDPDGSNTKGKYLYKYSPGIYIMLQVLVIYYLRLTLILKV